jgi:hypothetical protein
VRRRRYCSRYTRLYPPLKRMKRELRMEKEERENERESCEGKENGRKGKEREREIVLLFGVSSILNERLY